MYIYLIYRTLKPKNPPLWLIQLISKIQYPFMYIKYKVIHHPTFYPIYVNVFYRKFIRYINRLSLEKELLLILIFAYIPKIVLLFIFIWDILINNKIEMFYSFLPLHIFSVIYYTIIQHVIISKESLTVYLEKKYSHVNLQEEDNPLGLHEWNQIIQNSGYSLEEFNKLSFAEKAEILTYSHPDDTNITYKHNPNAIHHGRTNVPIREYLDILWNIALNRTANDPEKLYDYIATPYCHEKIYEKYRNLHNTSTLTLQIYQEIAKDFAETCDIIQSLAAFIENKKRIEENYKIKYLKISIYAVTLFCWLFLLVISYYVFPPDFEITLNILINTLENFKNIEPFSDTTTMLTFYIT